ncbi:MAG TPA: SCO family protein [Gemmatimonadaceae bacterium]|nr:SCO family protein [Gemmatimonadaceae bacterium]
MRRRTGRPGLALVTLLAIVAITTAWWALALWPAGASEPEWLVRTRAACFGAAPGGLPDAGGWILLIGEPLGMMGVFLAIWRQSLAEDLRRLRADPLWRIVVGNLTVAAIVAVGLLGARVARGYGVGRSVTTRNAGVLTRLDAVAPSVTLVDQHEQQVALGDYRGRPALLTVAFGHCTTVCPTIVGDLMAARRSAGRTDVRLLVLTLDPWRDTPDRLPTLAEHWGLARDDRVLSGSIAEVEAALDGLGIARTRNETTGAVDHVATVLFLDARGRVAWRLDGWWGGVAALLDPAHR